MSNAGTYRIGVTADDIQRGKQHSPWHCPIARAIRRTLRVKEVAVGSEISLYGRFREREIITPKRALKFTLHFDADRKSVSSTKRQIKFVRRRSRGATRQ